MKVVNVPIKDDNQVLQVIYGEVYIPNVLDSHKEWMTHWEITAMAHEFMRRGDLAAIDREHDNVRTGAYVVESYIANKDDPIFIEGSWVVGVKLPDEMWELYLSGEINGFSFEGLVERSTELTDVEIPFTMTGVTGERDGHIHYYKVFFNDQGDFLGGETSGALDSEEQVLDSHIHSIVKGTVTNDTNGHNHTFNFIDALVEEEGDEDES